MDTVSDYRNTLDHDGFVIVNDILPKALAGALVEEVARLGYKSEKDGQRISSDFAALTPVILNDSPLLKLLRDSAISDVVRGILGSAVDIFNSESVMKHPNSDRVLPWHQDAAYFKEIPPPILNVWIPLNDAKATNGTMRVLKGSQAQGILPHSDHGIGLECYSSDGPNQGLALEMPVGGVAFFGSFMVHKGGTNRSSLPFKTLVLQCVAREDSSSRGLGVNFIGTP